MPTPDTRPSLAVLNANQLVTLYGPARPRVGPELRELGILPGGSLFARDGKIASIGTAREIERLVDPNTHVVDATGRVVLPGFVDAHTHFVFAGNRLDDFDRRAEGQSYRQIAEEGGGILHTVRETRTASEEMLYLQAAKHARWMLQSGTTTAECKSGYGLDLETELKMLRVIRRVGEQGGLRCVPTFLGAHAVPPEFNGRPEAYVALVLEEMIQEVVRYGLAEFCDCFCEEGYFSSDQCKRVLVAAKSAGLKGKIHADQLTSSGGAELAAELGTKTADHLEQTGSEGIAALRDAKVQPVLLPGSVYALGLSRYPDARVMIEAGLAPVLATDFNPGSSPTPSMPMVMSLACTQMKMTPTEALTCSTINAAYSLDRGHSVGSLEIGKEADLAVFDCEDYREIAYIFGRNAVSQVFVGGRAV